MPRQEHTQSEPKSTPGVDPKLVRVTEWEAVAGHLAIVNRARGLIGQRPVDRSIYKPADVVKDSEHYQATNAWARERAQELGLSPQIEAGTPDWDWEWLARDEPTFGTHATRDGWVGLKWFLLKGGTPSADPIWTHRRMEEEVPYAGPIVTLAGEECVCVSDGHRIIKIEGSWFNAEAVDIMVQRGERCTMGIAQNASGAVGMAVVLRGRTAILLERGPPVSS